MRLLTLGDSWTFGDELEDRSKQCFSTLLSRRLNAEVDNPSTCGLSNHAIARIFLETDISAYDLVIIQMSQISRTEWYDKKGVAKMYKSKLQNKPYLPKMKVDWDKIMTTKDIFMRTGHILDGKEWWMSYYEELYDDKYGESDEMLFFHLIKNKLANMSIPHIMMTINKKTKMPFDLQLNKSKYPRAKGDHPTSVGHVMIASDIMKLL